jgi:hypothetical protein
MTDGPGFPPPPARWEEPPPPPYDPGSENVLKPVGIALVVYNSISIMIGLGMVLGFPALARMIEEEAKQNPELKSAAEFYASPWLAAIGGVGALLSIVALVGSVYLLRGRSYALAITGAILTMVNPGSQCCCVIGIALGVWALVVLLKPEAQAVFNRP